MPHVWMSHVTRTNDPCHTSEGVISHVRMSNVTLRRESRDTYECVMPRIWMSHVTPTNDPCQTYALAISYSWRSCVTRANESCHKHGTRCTTNNNQQPCTALPCNQIPGNSLKGQQAPQSLHMINLVARCLLRMSTSLTIKPFHIWMSNITNMITEWAFVTIILFFSVYKRNLRI